MNIEIPMAAGIDISIPVPVSVALILLGLFIISLIFPGWVKFLGVVFRRKFQSPEERSTRIFLVVAGALVAGLGVYLLLNEQPISADGQVSASVACPYDGVASTAAEAIPWLINQEADAVLSKDLDLIKEIFASNATIIEYENRAVKRLWNNPIDRYQPLFANSSFTSAQNTDIRAMSISSDNARYYSGSNGTLITNGQRMDYINPDDASHWTLKKIAGCWRIFKFEFNASGVRW